MTWICRVFDALRGPRLFEVIWRLLCRVRALSADELKAAASVLGASVISYSAVRVADGGVLGLIFRLNRRRAFASFHTINIPGSSASSSSHLDLFVHELTHVYQFEVIGSIYIWQALRAQRSAEGYNYGGWTKLVKDWSQGKHYREYNREQQAQMAQDYYKKVVSKGLPAENPISRAYEPFINELRNGEL
jgi:hypothetical protein